MATLRVTAEELRKAAHTIERSLEAYESANHAALSAGTDLAGKWEGEAQRAFVAEQEKARAWYKKMGEIVRTYTAAMEAAAKVYEAADLAASMLLK